MKRVLGFSAAAVAAFFLARTMSGPGGARPEAELAMERRAAARASSTALPDAGRPWTPPVEKGNIRTLKVADVPAPGRARTPEEEAQVAAVDAAARAPRAEGGGYADDSPAWSGGFRSVDAPPLRVGAQPGPEAGAEESAAVVSGAAPTGGTKDRKAPPRPPRPQADDAAWAEQGAGLAKTAKSLHLGGAKEGDPPRLDLSRDPIGRQLMLDQKVGGGVRSALEKLSASGGVTPEAAEAAAAAVLSANGIEPTPDEVKRQLALADAPVQPAPSPHAVRDVIAQLNSNLPDDATQERLARDAQRPPARPTGPMPRSVLEAFRQNRAVLDGIKAKYGIDPEYVLAICRVESNCGQNMGNHPVRDTIYSIQQKSPVGSSRRAQADRDLAALARLHMNGELGNQDLLTLRGSYAGAYSPTQFLPSSFEAYGRSPTGGKRNPFDMATALESTANYLHRHGFSRSPDRAIWGYNHSQEYVDKVKATAAQIKQSLAAEMAAPPR